MKTLTPALAALTLAAASPALAVDLVEDFTSFSGGVNSFIVGTDLDQTFSDTIGTSSGAASAIDGDSVFLTIDTSAVDRSQPGGYGAGARFTVSDPIDAGDLSSTDAADYSIVFDAAAVGFDPQFVDVILQFRAAGVGGVTGQYGVNQGNSASVSALVASLASGDAPVSASISLADFNLSPSDQAALPTADSFQFQFFTRSNNAEAPNDPYSAGAANVLVLDNVGISVVPEPASAALLAGGLGLLARRRRTV